MRSSLKVTWVLDHLRPAGHRHSLAVTDDGRVFAWGQQLGASLSSDSDSGDGASRCSSEGGGSGAGGGRLEGAAHAVWTAHRERQRLHAQPDPVAGPGTDAPEPVAQVAAGGRHSLALTRSGVVLAWGSNLQVSGDCSAGMGANGGHIQALLLFSC
jgi:alpha-tubulin suppressor-like RCC1 family protein